MHELPIGLGAYTAATLQQITTALPRGGLVLVMGVDGDERHDLAGDLVDRHYSVARRRFIEDGDQIDFNLTVEQNVDRWYGAILGGLAPANFKHLYRYAVGFNEMYNNSHPEQFHYLAAVDLGICRRLAADGIGYAFGSIAVGNVDPGPFAEQFATLCLEAAAVSAHLYLKPGTTTLESDVEPWWARRPYLWWLECQKRHLRFPALLASESGPYTPATYQAMSADQRVTAYRQIGGLLATWRSQGMPVIGQCTFGVGTVGRQSAWAHDHETLVALGQFNARKDLDMTMDTAAAAVVPGVDALIMPGAVLDLSPNFGYPRGAQGRNGQHVMALVDHIEGGPEGATDNWFQNPVSGVSANASIDRAGVIRFHVPGRDAAWGNGILNNPNLARRIVKWCMDHRVNPNLVTFSTEHEGVPGQPWTEVQYQASLHLKRWALNAFHLPRDPEILLQHADFDSVTRAHCPGPAWPRDRFLADLGITAPAPTPKPLTFAQQIMQRPNVLGVMDDLWALAEGRRVGGDAGVADDLEAGIIRTKQLLNL